MDRQVPVPPDVEIPVVDFFRPPLFSNPELNPAGTHFAALITTPDDRQALLVYDLAAGTFDWLQGLQNVDVYNFDWLTDDRILFGVSKEKQFAEGLYVTSLRNLASSYAVIRYSAVWPVCVPRSDPLRPILWTSSRGYGLERIDVQSESRVPGEEPIDRIELPGGGPPYRFLADKDGSLAFGFTERKSRQTLSRYSGGHWIHCPVDPARVDVIEAGDEPDELVVRGPRRDGRPRTLMRMNAASGRAGGVLLDDDTYEFNTGFLYRHPVDRHILGVQYNRQCLATVWLDPKYAAMQTVLESYFPQALVRVLGSDAAERRFFVAVYSDRLPVSYYQVDFEKRSLGLIKNVAPWIDPARMRPMEVVHFRTRDGFEVEAYVTFPDGASKERPAPLVVLLHGGPWSRDVWAWNAEVQFLASRGYAVFQPNYRGSAGYDWRFPPDDMWAFRKMHDDVTDGVKAMLAGGRCDPGRVAIMGTSFGGFLALCGVTFEPDLYRCAVTMSGVYDWEQMMRESQREDVSHRWAGALRQRFGDPRNGHVTFDAISPLRHTESVKVPVFVAHGRDDNVASVAQSHRLVSSLRKHGVPVEAHFESEEGHGIARLEDRVALYEQIERFLARTMQPRVVTQP